MKKAIHFLKRYAALAIDLPRRYESDILFHTKLNVASLGTAFAVLCVAFFALGMRFENSLSAVAYSWFGVTVHATIVVFVLSAALALLFGVALARVSLKPAQRSLLSQKLFISNIAHELRTPLAVIKTLTEVEMLEPKLPDESRKTLAQLLEEVDRASGIINNLVSLNQLMRPKPVEQDIVDLGGIIDRTIARSGRVAFERGIEVLVSKPADAYVVGNAVALEQLVINLTNNAIQYTPAQHRGRVTVTVRRDFSGNTVLSVADTGIGIKSDDLPHIFEPFYRGDKSRARNIKDGSAGMGLAIAHEIVRAHRGELRVKSTQGKGTVFTVVLPSAEKPYAEA